MKRSIVFLVLVSVFIVGLSACGGGSGPTESYPSSADTPVPEPSATPIPTDTPTMEPTATMELTVPPEFVGVAPITDFDKVAAVFESQELGITVQYPLGWTAKQNLDMQTIVVVDDWIAFTEGDADADSIGILIMSLSDASGSAEEILVDAESRLENYLTEQIDSVVLEERNGQEFAWAEYIGEPTAYYFVTTITDGANTVLVSVSVDIDRKDEVRPIYQAIVSRIELLTATAPILSNTPTPTDATTLTKTLALTPAFQPVESSIAFMSARDGNFEIYIMSTDDREETNLTNNPADDLLPVWSSDGQQIAFVSDRDGNSEIYAMNVNGSEVIRVTDDSGSDFMPSWLPNGQIGFLSDRDGLDYEIYIINVDGSGLTRLTQNESEELSPVWSPDGTLIAFEVARDSDREIYVMRADGSGQVNLTNNNETIDIQPSWSPDGTQIVFASTRDDNQDIYVMNSDGSHLRRLTDDPAYDSDPDWSPDGAHIVFVSDRFGSPEIFMMDRDGTGLIRLTYDPPNLNPVW